MYRSTKGASKARRDQINAEIRNLKDLLPISDADKAKLSYLHIMSLACMYTRKAVFFSQPEASAETGARFLSFPELSELMRALPGFIMLLTAEGKLLYLSDAVSEHLGHSMVDLVAQGDSVYDIVDASDQLAVRNSLSAGAGPETDVLFRCRFNTSKSVRRQSAGNKLVLIRARRLSAPAASASYWTSNPVWVCFCSPLEAHPARCGTDEASGGAPLGDANLFLEGFHSQHGRDLRLHAAHDSVRSYLGYDVAALRSRSWYSLLHPHDLSHASAQHRSLLREGGEGRAEMVVRVQARDGTWVWLYMALQLQSGEVPVASGNYVISESEARSARRQLISEQTRLSPVPSSGPARPESLRSPDALSSPDQVFTPGSGGGPSGQAFDFGAAASSSDERAARTEGEARSSLSSLEEDAFFRPPPSAAPSPTPVTVETVSDLDFLTQNILMPPSFELDPPLPALPLPLPPVPASQAQQSKEFVCTPPYTPHVGGGTFPFGEPLFSFDPTGTTTPPPSATTATASASASSAAPPAAASGPAPPSAPSAKLALSLPAASTELLFASDPCCGALYEKLPPTPDSPGDDDCTVMTLPEVRGPLYVDVPLGPLQCPPEGLLTPEASPGKQTRLSFFSPEREKERAEISLLARHISTLAEGFYLDPLLSKLSPSSDPPSPFLAPVETADSVQALEEFYSVKAWRGPDLPLFLEEDVSLFEESVLESLLPQYPSPPPVRDPASPVSPQSPLRWRRASPSEGAGQFCSVRSARPDSADGCGVAGEEEPAEEAMETEEASTPMFSCSPLVEASPPPPPPLVASPGPLDASGAPAPVTSCAQSLLEELAALEPVFGAGASVAPALGQQPELYQLQCHPSPQCFHKDGSGSIPPF
ncbi:neuronal PAS domain-containing protein 4A [Corythoichthys intestinalis]|uniref:neuronal PAS domain-containing protein 4A n=1 Tax=Corythoichthys intestinalis TaxID=161448 RepID=UPI0025A670E3|nr:neuronal PAS domain-containing protein 4A [Corythoichthys intestinalis]XP_061793571.1 neuronal PAS domain-containing protein 4A-like [Nerophis lumbriciformis]